MRLWAIVAAVMPLTAALTSCRREKPMDRRRQEIVVRHYRRLPEATRSRVETTLKTQGLDLPREFAEFDQNLDTRLAAATEVQLQAVIDETLIPVPILNGSFRPVLTDSFNPAAPVLTDAQQKGILTRAASVGRLQTFDGKSYSLYGTGFVVGRNESAGLIATNCHVIDDRSLTPLVPDSTAGSLVPSGTTFEIDFGDSPARTAANIFRIVRIMPCAQTGLDAALLVASLASIDGAGKLPGKLSFTKSALTNNFSAGQTELIGAVGYPALGEANSQSPYTRIFTRFDRATYAKFYSPGEVSLILPKSGIDFLLHNVSTMAGYSGSPLLDLNSGSVVGVHACCTWPGGQLPTTRAFLPCAQKLIAPPINFSLSSWSVVADKALAASLHVFGVQ